MSEKTVVLVGTLDTKGAEYQYMCDRLALAGVKTILVDVGTLDRALAKPDITRQEVAAEAGFDLEALTAERDRGQAVTAMADAAAIVVRRLYDQGRCDGVLAAGGSGNTAIAATMFGVTTPSVTAAREELERRGYEVLTFHATGTGGRAMEALVESGFVTGVLDITTTELADELVGGVLSAGSDRLEMAGKLGVPQVVSVGALDMVNFGARDTVPPQFESRNLYVHNPSVTLMRTTPAESAELGRQIAKKLSAARGPVALFVPLRGVSAISGEGGPFYDAAADKALFGALRQNMGKNVEMHEVDAHINDPEFAHAMAARLDELMKVRR